MPSVCTTENLPDDDGHDAGLALQEVEFGVRRARASEPGVHITKAVGRATKHVRQNYMVIACYKK
jgi:hypothetical protein